MTQYYCFCGKSFKKKEHILKHVEFNNSFFPEDLHYFMGKRSWIYVFIDCIYPKRSIVYLALAVFMLFSVMQRHNVFNLSMLEAFFLGLGIGFLWLSLKIQD